MAQQRIVPVVKGDKNRTIMHTTLANEVIAAINEHDQLFQALKKIAVSPATAGTFQISDGNIVLVLNTVKCP